MKVFQCLRHGLRSRIDVHLTQKLKTTRIILETSVDRCISSWKPHEH